MNIVYQALISETKEKFEVLEDETILEAALRANVQIAHQCQIGMCSTCRVKLELGSVKYRDQPDLLSPEEIAAGYVLSCQAQPTSDLVFHAERRLPPCSIPREYKARISRLELLSLDVYKLTISLEDSHGLVYRPGQYANFMIGNNCYRSFSMASNADVTQLEFFMKKVPGGLFTDRMLSQLNSGDELRVELPFGSFAYHDDDYKPVIFAATATGIAPIKSMLEAMSENPDCPPVSLYWGVRTEADLFLSDIEVWSKKLEDFTYIPVLSQPSKSWSGRVGHVQDRVAEDFSDLSEYAIYLCGSPAMISDASKAFAKLNADISHLYTDAFNFQESSMEIVVL